METADIDLLRHDQVDIACGRGKSHLVYSEQL